MSEPEPMRVSREVPPHAFRESARMVVRPDGLFVACGECGHLSDHAIHAHDARRQNTFERPHLGTSRDAGGGIDLAHDARRQ